MNDQSFRLRSNACPSRYGPCRWLSYWNCWWRVAVVAARIAQLLLIVLAGWPAGMLTAQEHASQTVTAATQQTLDQPLELQGAILKTIEATTLAAAMPGPLRELSAREGDVVQIGQAMGKIYDEPLKLELMQLKTQVALAQKKQANDINQRLAHKGLQVANNEYQRAQSANARVPDTYPINEIDRLKLIADQAQLEVERAQYEQELAALEVTLAQGSYRQCYERYMRHQLQAPASGVVVAVERRAGEWVEPGTELLRIVRIDPLRVEGFLAAEQTVENLVGRTAVIGLVTPSSLSFASATAASASAPAPATTNAPLLEGRVVFVSPDANPVNSQVRVFIEVANPEGQLRPGMRVNARIVDR